MCAYWLTSPSLILPDTTWNVSVADIFKKWFWLWFRMIVNRLLEIPPNVVGLFIDPTIPVQLNIPSEFFFFFYCKINSLYNQIRIIFPGLYPYSVESNFSWWFVVLFFVLVVVFLFCEKPSSPFFFFLFYCDPLYSLYIRLIGTFSVFLLLPFAFLNLLSTKEPCKTIMWPNLPWEISTCACGWTALYPWNAETPVFVWAIDVYVYSSELWRLEFRAWIVWVCEVRLPAVTWARPHLPEPAGGEYPVACAPGQWRASNLPSHAN